MLHYDVKYKTHFAEIPKLSHCKAVGTVVYQSDKTSGNFWDLPCKVTCESNSLYFSA
jgi:hypothetical protein